MKTRLYLSAALAALSPAAAWAAAAVTDIDTIVVTASRAPERADLVGGQITVLDRADIDAQQTPIVSNLLARAPGVAVTRNGGVGGATQLRIRGAETEQTVVLIDGVKLNDPSATGSGYNFANLVTGDVSRIEVLRGAQSVIWGSQAIGGVVNLITADPEAPFEGRVDAEGGARESGYVQAAVGGKSERVMWRASAGYLTTGGISQFDEAQGGREKDGYRNTSAAAKATVALTEQLSLDLRGVYSRGRNQFDGFPAPAFAFGDTREYGITRDLVAYAGLNLDLLDGRFVNRAAFAYTRTDRDNFNPDQAVTTRTFDAAGHNRRFEYQGTWKVSNAWSAVFGAESERSSMRTASPSSFTPNPVPGRRKAQLDSVYGQLKGGVAAGLTVAAGLRHDDHGDFGGHTVGQASAAWSLNEGTTVLRASWGQGFKAPSLFQLGSEFGNAALAPESAETWDAGVEQRFAKGRIVLSGAYFERDTKNQIDFVSCFSTPALPLCRGPNGAARTGFYDNFARTEARGVELEGEARLTDDLTLSANYTYTRARNDTRGGANRGKRLARRPQDQAYGEATYRWPVGVTTAVAVRYIGASFDDAANRNRLKSVTLTDLRAIWPIRDKIELYGRVENLFDRRYQTIRNYGQPGRAAYAGVRASF
jgi:vitamin B12 transporter